MKQIDELYLNVRIQWCERGIWNGNNESDILAKQSVDDYIKFGGFKYGTYQTPISSNILKTHIKNEWRNIKYTNIKNINNIAVISRNMEIWNIYDEKQLVIWDMKQYNKTEAGILTQLQTEHIHLNWYFHVRKHYIIYKKKIETYGYINETYECKYHCCADSNDGLCVECDKPETVYHFLIECKRYTHIRNFYLLPIYKLLQQYNKPLTLRNYLFPSLKFSWFHRKMILDNVINYVLSTARIHYY
ncbi:MAG: hypothetical protein GY737_04240, partial [Desulfobacteraceae bacterium]|nr:hypothetical protein [Desulfobacteraceae bacterium]